MCSGDFVEIYMPKNLNITANLAVNSTSNRKIRTDKMDVDIEVIEKEKGGEKEEEKEGEGGNNDTDIYWDAVVTCFFVDTAPVVIGKLILSVMLCYVMLCYVMICYVILCYVML